MFAFFELLSFGFLFDSIMAPRPFVPVKGLASLVDLLLNTWLEFVEMSFE